MLGNVLGITTWISLGKGVAWHYSVCPLEEHQNSCITKYVFDTLKITTFLGHKVDPNINC